MLFNCGSQNVVWESIAGGLESVFFLFSYSGENHNPPLAVVIFIAELLRY